MENWRLLIVSILVLTIIACAPRGQRTGVRLIEVVPYSPADNARLGVGDYIVEVSPDATTKPCPLRRGFCLLSLRGVDSVEPDTLTRYLDGVAVDNAGLAGDVGHRH